MMKAKFKMVNKDVIQARIMFLKSRISRNKFINDQRERDQVIKDEKELEELEGGLDDHI